MCVYVSCVATFAPLYLTMNGGIPKMQKLLCAQSLDGVLLRQVPPGFDLMCVCVCESVSVCVCVCV